MKPGSPAAWMLAGALSLLAAGVAAQPADGDATAARLQLTAVQNALAAEDRTAFDERLGALRSGVQTSASSTLARELLPLYELVARLWDVQFSGAFFAEDSDLHAEVSRYRGFGEAMRRSIVTDAAGRRFFAAREARIFLAGIAAERLAGAGIRTVAVDPPPSAVSGPAVSRGTARAASGGGARRVRRAKQ